MVNLIIRQNSLFPIDENEPQTVANIPIPWIQNQVGVKMYNLHNLEMY